MNTINPYGKLTGVRNGATTGKPAQNSQESKPSTPGTDSVDLSSTAEQLGRMQTRLDEASGIDRAKVEAIKTAIANGEYKVNAEKVAEQLIALEKERLA